MNQSSDTLLDVLLRGTIFSKGKSSKEEDYGAKFQDALSQAEIEYRKEKTKEIKKRNELRYGYADLFIQISCGSLIFVGIMVFLNANPRIGLYLSDTVLVALLGTALSTVFAPTILLAKYLFKYDEGNKW
ncbi:MAG: hypothetical protein F4246_10900 [Rhodothermaceae bacterium]|nr:hypothetical protein [Rhodothermaceae bacterium]MXX59782.1 hypothetical protein [Rhodothermaceae bacterium]MYD19905.1 hypothetical protein [Rhodothermaceae bacterium]MYD57507.1 hypothetical protein [Rhodothermaceae bacterium]MYI44181.1 hypothetical protein [Rhodothermaceae bacterium]